MQFRIWADTVNGGMHKSMTELLSYTMFNCAGGMQEEWSWYDHIGQTSVALEPKHWLLLLQV